MVKHVGSLSYDNIIDLSVDGRKQILQVYSEHQHLHIHKPAQEILVVFYKGSAVFVIPLLA